MDLHRHLKEEWKRIEEDIDIEERCWDGYEPVPGKEPYEKGSCRKTEEYNLFETETWEGIEEDEITLEGEVHGALYEEDIVEAEYQGRKVTLNKPTRGDVKKFKVYVKNDKGNVVKVNFGDPNMKIRKSNPEARKSFRARHNCDNPGPKWKARYWSCRKWEEGVEEEMSPSIRYSREIEGIKDIVQKYDDETIKFIFNEVMFELGREELEECGTAAGGAGGIGAGGTVKRRIGFREAIDFLNKLEESEIEKMSEEDLQKIEEWNSMVGPIIAKTFNRQGVPQGKTPEDPEDFTTNKSYGPPCPCNRGADGD